MSKLNAISFVHTRCCLLASLALVFSFGTEQMASAAEPVVSEIVINVRTNEHVSLVDITFTLTHDEGKECYIFPFAHNPTTREHIPMTAFLKVGGIMWLNELATNPLAPGMHTLTWLPGADWGDREFGDIVVYVRADDSERCAPGRFMVIDLSGGPSATNYPHEIKHFVDVQQDIYKTDKLVLRELPNGQWAGVYEVTQRQYERVTGATPSHFGGNPMRPVEQVSWNDIKAADGFIARIQTRTGIAELDLPEETLWEYACRAGATRDFSDYTEERGKGSDSSASLDILGWYSANSGSRTHDVGEQQANAWDLFDMHGNVWEWNLTPWGSLRVKRGGSWLLSAGFCAAGSRSSINPDYRISLGFRLFLPAGRP